MIEETKSIDEHQKELLGWVDKQDRVKSIILDTNKKVIYQIIMSKELYNELHNKSPKRKQS